MASNLDPLEVISRLMLHYGYQLETESNRAQVWRQQLVRTALIWLAFLYYAGISLLLPSGDRRVLNWGDFGYAIFPNQNRNLLNMIALIMQCNLLLLQTNLLLRDRSHRWLREANQLFHQMQSVHVPERILGSIARSYLVTQIQTVIFFVLAAGAGSRLRPLTAMERVTDDISAGNLSGRVAGTTP